MGAARGGEGGAAFAELFLVGQPDTRAAAGRASRRLRALVGRARERLALHSWPDTAWGRRRGRCTAGGTATSTAV